jgi:hypothetical protein
VRLNRRSIGQYTAVISDGDGSMVASMEVTNHEQHQAGHFLRPVSIPARVDFFLKIAAPDGTTLLALDHEDQRVPLIVSGVVIVACSSESELDVRKSQRASDGDRDRFDRYRLCIRWRRNQRADRHLFSQ